MGFGTLIQRITYKVSGRSSSSSGLYVPSTDMYDYAIGGVPFLSATSDVRPDTEKPVPQRKQQFDNYKDPGEYSLNQWWLRSQTSFTGGAGVTYQDPDTAGVTAGTSINLRYHKSVGVDPFSLGGALRLLKETNKSTVYTSALGANLTCTWEYGGGAGNPDKLWLVDTQGNVSRTSIGTSDVAIGGFVSIGGDTSIDYNPLISSSLYVYNSSIVLATAGLYKITPTPGLTAVRIYAPSAAGDVGMECMTLSRGFIFANNGEKLFALDPNAAPNTPWPASVATVPAQQRIISIVDGPDAVYVAANDTLQGYIYKSTFNPTTGLVNGLTQVAVMPKGEIINCMNAYVATYMRRPTVQSSDCLGSTGYHYSNARHRTRCWLPGGWLR
jgi:hypothetical protein